MFRDLRPGEYVRLDKIEYGGSLEGRRLKSDKVAFYWRYTQDGKTCRISIGNFDGLAPPKSLKPTDRGYSIAAAKQAARDLARKNAELPGGFRGEAERVLEEKGRNEREAAERSQFTVEKLFEAYCDWLEQMDKPSYREARQLFKNHIAARDSSLAGSPAAEVEKHRFIVHLRSLTEAGKLSTARKLRSYLRAAFACAVRAESDPSIPAAFVNFRVNTNPIEAIAAVRSRADKRPLSVQELRRYWNALQDEDTAPGATLRIHLLSGGQRVAQLVRLQAQQIFRDSFELKDPKGRRHEPRSHAVPLTPAIRKEFNRLPKAGYVFSTDGGKTPMHATSLTTWSKEIAVRAGLGDFQLKRVRSGIETALASVGIPPHVRAQLQSHGISGVQSTHYDAHHYLPEKREALGALHVLLQKRGRLK